MAPDVILALDPATRTGYAHSAGRYGVWDLGIRGTEHEGRRLVRLRDQLLAAHGAWGFNRLAFEEASFGSHNPSVQAFHNELRGVIKHVAAELQVPFVGYHIGTIKAFACGNGHAKKDQMIRAAKTVLGIETTDDNVADALFVLELAKTGHDGATKKQAARKVRQKLAKEPRLF